MLSIGKDVICDSGLIIDVLTELDITHVARSKNDKAYEAFGNTVFQAALPLVPQAVLTPDFVKDRETIFREFLRSLCIPIISYRADVLNR